MGYQLTITIDELLHAVSSNHKYANKLRLREAYSYAEEKHRGQKRKSGEPYIMHPVRVAKMLADWGFDDSVVAAALLHDVIEDCQISPEELSDKFNADIANLVQNVTSVSKEFAEANHLTKEECDKLSDALLLKSINENALFIKIADRIDNLSTIGSMPPEKQYGKAQHTREILIPCVKKEGAYELVDRLEELCLEIEHKDRYTQIKSRCDMLLKSNALTLQKVIDLFQSVFSPTENNPMISRELQPYREAVADFKYGPRSIISIYRQLTREAHNLDDDLPKLLTKQNVSLYDFTLLINAEKLPSDVTPLDVFFQYYERFFYEHKLCILTCCQKTTYGDSSYLLFCDEMENIYRIFVRSTKDYLRYKLGHITDVSNSIALLDVNEIDPRDCYNKKIKVFRKDGSEMYIDEGATVLDFAFAIHGDLGILFDYALIDNSTAHFPAHTRLNEGDKVIIRSVRERKEPCEPKAEMIWFRYIRTSKAVHGLMKYLLGKQG